MDLVKLQQFAEQFAQELNGSEDLKAHVADHRRRSQRAQSFLTPERIPQLTEAELRELFLDSDSFGFWRNKTKAFNSRVQNFGLDGLRQALLELVTRASRGLTADDLKHVWGMRGLGTLLSTEILAYRFPAQYWTYSENVTLPVLRQLGEDIRANMPQGHRSNPYMYMAVGRQMASVRQALMEAGVPEPDYLIADIFLWWANGRPNPSQESGDRASESYARQVLEKLLPQPDTRKTVLTLLVNYIQKAHTYGPAAWGTTLFVDQMRLNIGRIQAFVIGQHEIYLVLDADSLTEEDCNELQLHGKMLNNDYTSTPRIKDIEISDSDLENVLPIVQKAYGPVVERAARTVKRCPYYQAHSSGVIKYLNTFLGQPIPNPDYGMNSQATVTTVIPTPNVSVPFSVSTTLAQSLQACGLHFTD